MIGTKCCSPLPRFALCSIGGTDNCGSAGDCEGL